MSIDPRLIEKYIKNIEILRERICTIVPKMDQHGYCFTIVCPLSNGSLEITESIMTRGLICVDEADGGYIIKIVFRFGKIDLIDTLAYESERAISPWLDTTTKEYRVVVSYVETFLEECNEISEFEVYSNINRSPLQPLISRSDPAIYLK